jgi:ADP-heptose:LPS heptosyltransferase
MNTQRNTTCRHYRGDRPCIWNKQDGSECSSCSHADTITERILIVKLDAIGDVLRSTCILPKLKAMYPRAFITWLTRSASAPLLSGNPFVDRVWKLDEPETLAHLQVQEWALVINLDNAFPSAALAAQAKAPKIIGFILSPEGIITQTNQAAEEWNAMAVFDRVKKENQRSYQQHMYAICGFEPPIERPVLVPPPRALEEAACLLRRDWLEPGEKLIGLNTGAGGRWPLKMMSANRQAELIHLLLKETHYKIVLLGGPEERERNRFLIEAANSSRVRDAGCDHKLPDFAALVAQCDALICGDTLALHVATALGVPAVVVFCPTSYHEIHDYDGLIAKIRPDDCACFCGYNRDCPWGKDCINTIPIERILVSLEKQWARSSCI